MQIYDIVYKLIFPIIKAVLIKSGYSEDSIRRKCGNISDYNPDGKKVIMFHGVSVGEINAIEKLIKKTREIFPEVKIVVTTGTNTGQEIAHKKLDDVADYITYFPFDFPECVDKFLNIIKPDAVFMAETEIWPIFVNGCKNNEVKLFIINGRISDRTYNSYKKLKFFFKPLLSKYTGIFTQSSEDLDKFISLGADIETTKRMNNLKFDITAPNVDFDIEKNGRILLGASTHSGEDEIVVNTYKNLKKSHQDLKLMIAPRHLTRMTEVENAVKSLGLEYGFRSKNDTFINKDIIILDTMGELGKMFKFADIAFIGGSFNKTGGHNPLEATIFSKPVISGPSIHNFKDIYSIIQNAKAGFVVETPKEFEQIGYKLLSNSEFYSQTSQASEEVFKSQQGALDFVINIIRSILK